MTILEAELVFWDMRAVFSCCERPGKAAARKIDAAMKVRNARERRKRTPTNQMIHAARRMRGGELIRNLDPAEQGIILALTGRSSGTAASESKALTLAGFSTFDPKESLHPVVKYGQESVVA